MGNLLSLKLHSTAETKKINLILISEIYKSELLWLQGCDIATKTKYVTENKVPINCNRGIQNIKKSTKSTLFSTYILSDIIIR